MLVEIDIPSATVTNRYQVADAKFLNDVAASNNGDIFVSDMMMDRVHVLKDGNFSIWLETPDLLSPNGLHVEEDSLVVGSWGARTEGFSTETPGHLLRIMFSDKSISNIGAGSPLGNMDGVEADLDGDYYVTDWMVGKLFHVDRKGNAELMLTLEQGMADLEFIAMKDMIVLPMMLNNKLLAYRLIYGD
jgi:sugar lactone lactonase YvrE